MEFEWCDLAFHREIGSAIDALDSPHFWARLTRVLERHIGIDSWVALRFAREGPPLVCAEQAMPDGKVDLMFQDYLAALYQIDPFYLAVFEQRVSGFFTLADVAPDNFRMTEYYQRYFRKNIIGDEVHFNLVIDADHTMGFSLGSTHRFDEREIALLTLFSPWVLALMQQRLRYENFGTGEAAMHPMHSSGAPDLPTRFGMLTEKSGRAALTAREIEVVMLTLSGYSSRAIAVKLAISFETVRAHKKHIYSKLGVGSQSELFAMFYKPGRMDAGGAS
ncbi:response regulator transcription factor [Burkholderia pseudomallei]|uniref:response regulator transcription factor n=1 Tax=Burkholderia pseudomallei TaxID=28450 RepID=UPI0005377F26|nr:helix-turn-helix transcriptional regulator [Burkholderia pseudomallei]KGW18114.1 bacterial regulatory s, luxR family protein [Burkholderia pseudomallei MSHR4000]KGW81058.1 bacterial regulatory s, luxR family protein [Burkholderia pseudomallei MSHR456]KGX23809.1 bacterial regulatory s, luxR family protein [Burkholderia pseudomallei ABCPW 1]MBF3524002.1 helix-turn-helix transcriptional regulator [Burkholderia pseudomallei]MBF3536864.1 helix-turn-helix transcriptional regulator [Burkholderia p